MPTYGQLDTIGAFYWYQGESDALDPTLYPEYQANLTALLTALRTSLPISPSATVVLVKESVGRINCISTINGRLHVLRSGDHG